MRIRDISVRKRLLFANFLMVFIPICLLTVISILLLLGLRYSAATQERELSFLWPEKGTALSVQYAVSSLRVKAEKKHNIKLKEILTDCHILESQGIGTVVFKDGQMLYKTEWVNSDELMKVVHSKCGNSQSTMLWDDDGFAFSYTSPYTGTTVLAAGNVPFLSKGDVPQENTKTFWEVVLLLVLGLALIIIIAAGFYLSRLLSSQILEPLAALRFAASEIQKGNLDISMQVPTQDELGETCKAFDRMRLELKHTKKTQEKYEQNRKELIAGISHDLSTPLTSVKGYASGILEGIAQTKEKQHHYVEVIYQKACTMEKLVESLFLFSKLDLGRVDFHLENVDIYAYFVDFVTEQATALAEQGLQLSLQGQVRHNLIRLDRLQFGRVVENLLGNSMKYKKNIPVHVNIQLSESNKKMKIVFADDGVGVADEELTKIFNSFYRTDPARTNIAKGNGLGLAIVKQIILRLHGTIWAEQTVGDGLTICMLLPIVEESNEKDTTDRR